MIGAVLGYPIGAMRMGVVMRSSMGFFGCTGKMRGVVAPDVEDYSRRGEGATHRGSQIVRSTALGQPGRTDRPLSVCRETSTAGALRSNAGNFCVPIDSPDRPALLDSCGRGA